MIKNNIPTRMMMYCPYNSIPSYLLSARLIISTITIAMLKNIPRDILFSVETFATESAIVSLFPLTNVLSTGNLYKKNILKHISSVSKHPSPINNEIIGEIPKERNKIKKIIIAKTCLEENKV